MKVSDQFVFLSLTKWGVGRYCGEKSRSVKNYYPLLFGSM